MNPIMDIKIWIMLGLILGFVLGLDHPDAPTMLIIALMIQMTLSLQGLKFDFSDVHDNKRGILACFLFTFGFNTAVTLLTGLLFIDNTALWYGWVMLSAVPCAISVISMTFYMKGDMKLGMLGFSCIYVSAIVLTPLITHVLMGEAASWLKILEYVLLFVIVPFVVNIPLNRITFPPKAKIMALNIVIMVMVFISVGFRRDYIIDNPDVALLLLGANFIRIFIPTFALIYILKHAGISRDRGVVYVSLSFWRNSGLAATLCIIMFSATYPEALLPAVLSLLLENLIFVILQGTFDKLWPESTAN